MSETETDMEIEQAGPSGLNSGLNSSNNSRTYNSNSLSAEQISQLRLRGGIVLYGDGMNGNEPVHVQARSRFRALTLASALTRGFPEGAPLNVRANMHERRMRELEGIALRLGGDSCILSITIHGPSLKRPIRLTIDTREDTAIADEIFRHIERVSQSEYGILSHQTRVEINIAMNHSGKGRVKAAGLFNDEIMTKKKNHFFSPQTPKYCFAACLVQYLNPVCDGAEIYQKARDLHHQVGLDAQGTVALNQIGAFQSCLNLNINVYYRNDYTNAFQLFRSNLTPNLQTPQVYLYLNRNHYHLITNVRVFLGYAYFCEFCAHGYKNLRAHKCPVKCHICLSPDCIAKDPKYSKKCADCNRLPRSALCYQLHKQPVITEAGNQILPQCGGRKYCDKCESLYNRPAVGKEHVCTRNKCPSCCEPIKQGDDDEHKCYIQPLTETEINHKLIFFDFECSQELDDSSQRTHVPVMLCAKDYSGKIEKTFTGSNCGEQFINFLRRPAFKGYTVLAHNGSGYDFYLLLRAYSKLGYIPECLANGGRIMYMHDRDRDLRFVDTFLHFPLKLDSTIKAFGLNIQNKGTFPYKFIKPENIGYKGPYPAKTFYNYESLSQARKEEFDRWYDEASKEPFDYDVEIKKYCMHDVSILRMASIEFQKSFYNLTKTDPFQSITLASSCMKTFRTSFLKPDTVALTNSRMFHKQGKVASAACKEWLAYMAFKHDIDIQSSDSEAGEYKLGPYYLDGHAVTQSGLPMALEFHGCFWHGHSCRFRPDDINPCTGCTYGDLAQKTLYRGGEIEKVYNHKLVSITECDWEYSKKYDPDVITFMRTYTCVPPLVARDALFGGRTEPFQLLHKTDVQKGDKILYNDVTSLYPFIMSTSMYPVGYPKRILRNFKDLSNYFGLIKCEIAAPRGLNIPVLPMRHDNKLYFPLCRTCVETKAREACEHDENERCLSGTWITPEIQYALEQGYRIIKIHEIWHFEEKTDKLFTEYVKTFLREKQHASGFPPGVVTPEEKQAYIDNYAAHEGIALDANKIQYNAPQRSINKLLLNTLWGRFCLRENSSVTKIVKDPEEFTQLLFSGDKKTLGFNFLDKDIVLLECEQVEGCSLQAKNVNEFIGAFTTGYGRLHLIKLLHKLGSRVLYCDTDSVIFKSGPEDIWNPSIDPYLGGLTDELGDENDYITEFVSTGPKSYAYKTLKGKACVKIKGITLTGVTGELFNVDTLTTLVDEYLEKGGKDCGVINTECESIKRNKKTLTLQSVTLKRRFRVLYEKRLLHSDGTTSPYGF